MDRPGHNPGRAAEPGIAAPAPRLRRPRPEFAHLTRLIDGLGVREYLEVEGSAAPGYRTGDAAQTLLVVLREDTDSSHLVMATLTCLAFLEHAVRKEGQAHDRLSPTGHWTDEPVPTESWGRAVAALGCTARMGATQATRDRATRAFLRAARFRSLDVRAASLAAVGAVALVRTGTEATGPARALLADCLAVIPRRSAPGWDWPEDRLTRTNAALCDALIVGGAALGRSTSVHQGLNLLGVLLDIETSARGHLSVTGTAGRAPGEPGPLWKQRPSDVAAIADACAHAFAITGDLKWRRGVWLAWEWFAGANDLGEPVYDSTTGVARDTLAPDGRSQTGGAEAALAALSTLQRVRDVSA